MCVPQVPADDLLIEHARTLGSVASGAKPPDPKRTRWPFSAGRRAAPMQSAREEWEDATVATRVLATESYDRAARGAGGVSA